MNAINCTQLHFSPKNINEKIHIKSVLEVSIVALWDAAAYLVMETPVALNIDIEMMIPIE
jgi:hypothetical protein